jgi:hypothetical protein
MPERGRGTGARTLDQSQHPPGGQHCQTLCWSGSAVSGFDPGRQPGIDEGSRESMNTSAGSASPPTPPGGSGRPSRVPSPIRVAPSGCLSTWSTAFASCTKPHTRWSKNWGECRQPKSLAEQVGILPHKVDWMMRVSWLPLSLESPINEDEEDAELGMFVEDDITPTPIQSAYSKLLSEKIQEVLDTLPPA